MDIKIKYTPDGELWGIYTIGHSYKANFFKAVRADDMASVELDAMFDDPDEIDKGDVQHAYMCQNHKENDNPDLWDWCSDTALGAVAITVIGNTG